MVRLSCSDKTERQGLLLAMNTITQTMRFRQADPLQVEPAVHLPLEETLRRHRAVSRRPLPPSPQSSKPAYTRRDQAHPRYEAPESSHWACGLLGQAETERLYALYLGSIPLSSQTRTDGSQAAQSQTQAQTLRADAVPRPARPDRREIRPSKLYCWTRKRNAVLSIHFYR